MIGFGAKEANEIKQQQQHAHKHTHTQSIMQAAEQSCQKGGRKWEEEIGERRERGVREWRRGAGGAAAATPMPQY